MLKRVFVDGIEFMRIPNPVLGRVNPIAVRNIPNIPSSGEILVTGFNKKENWVLFSKTNPEVPDGHIFIGHLLNSVQVREEIDMS